MTRVLLLMCSIVWLLPVQAQELPTLPDAGQELSMLPLYLEHSPAQQQGQFLLTDHIPHGRLLLPGQHDYLLEDRTDKRPRLRLSTEKPHINLRRRHIRLDNGITIHTLAIDPDTRIRLNGEITAPDNIFIRLTNDEGPRRISPFFSLGFGTPDTRLFPRGFSVNVNIRMRGTVETIARGNTECIYRDKACAMLAPHILEYIHRDTKRVKPWRRSPNGMIRFVFRY